MKTLDTIAAIFLVIGGANWGLYAVTGYDLVGLLLGNFSMATRLVYLLVGLSALYQALNWQYIQHRWRKPDPRAPRLA